MNEQNNLSTGISNTIYVGGNAENNSGFTEQLEKLNKVRESIWSPYGWSSQNVNQSSKWSVDLDESNMPKYHNNTIQGITTVKNCFFHC